MHKLLSKILFFLGFLLILHSCSVTNKLENDELYLKANEYTFTGEKKFKGELEDYVRQKPNNKFFGVLPIKDWVYNSFPKELDPVYDNYKAVDRAKRSQKLLDSLYEKFNVSEKYRDKYAISRWLYNGHHSVLLDSTIAQNSALNLERFYFDRGYFDAIVDYEIKKDGDKKAHVEYQITMGEPSMIDTYQHQFNDSVLQEIYLKNQAKSFVKENKQYDDRDFVQERTRLQNLFQNNGFYGFNDSGDELIFRVDSTQSKQLKVTLKVDKPGGFKPYNLGKIKVYADSNPNETVYETEHLGYTILSENPLQYKPRVFTDAIVLEEGDTYALKKVNQTRKLFFERENFRLRGIELDADTLTGKVDVNILLRPKKKYDFEMSFEGAYSQFLNLGVSPGVSLLTRNVFGGGENLEFSLRGTIGTVNRSDLRNEFFNAYEWAFESRLHFPRLLLPFNTEGLFPKSYNPSSSIHMGFSQQKNIGLGSTTYTTGLEYNFSPGITQHRFKIFNTEYTRNAEADKYYRIFAVDNAILEDTQMAYFIYDPATESQFLNGEISVNELEDLMASDTNFINNLPVDTYTFDDFTNYRNMLFRKATITQNVLIESMSYAFTYDQNKDKNFKHPFYLYTSVELGGALLSLADTMFGLGRVDTQFDTSVASVAGVPFSQFTRIDLDIRKTWQLSKKSSFAVRNFVGLGIPYGNLDILPFNKSYFGGGSNDVRAWQAYNLSPAPLRPGDDGTYIDNFKITWNAEYRFNISGIFNSALFVDAGNIWNLDVLSGGVSNESTAFKFNEFWSQLGIGSGFGLRFDFTYFLLRLDFAYKMHDPAYEEGNRWFTDVNLLRPQVQFGINYPF